MTAFLVFGDDLSSEFAIMGSVFLAVLLPEVEEHFRKLRDSG